MFLSFHQPVSSVLEFYVPPFDHLLWDNPGQSTISDLSNA